MQIVFDKSIAIDDLKKKKKKKTSNQNSANSHF